MKLKEGKKAADLGVNARACAKCTKGYAKICKVCAHLIVAPTYNKHRKNPPIHYIIFTNPIVKIPSPKKTAIVAVFFSV